MGNETEAPTLTGTPLFDETAIDSLLSDMADWADCKCAAAHDERCPVCSVEVVALFRSCNSEKLICQNTVTVAKGLMLTPVLHDICLMPVSECWSVRPI